MSKHPGNDSGGAGSVATAGDYLRFAQMPANGGVLDGQRGLSRTTNQHMTSDHLGSRLALAETPGGSVLGASTYTFGLGFAVRPSNGIAPVPGSAGDFYWGGYAGTSLPAVRQHFSSEQRHRLFDHGVIHQPSLIEVTDELIHLVLTP